MAFDSIPSRRTVRRTRRLAAFTVLCVTLVQAPLAAAGSQVVPPPVPFYSYRVSKTTMVGAGMIVIETQDSLDRVLDWYRANLKDQMGDVTVGPGHHHFLTHNGAGVDVLADGTGAGAGTKITLFWKSGGDAPYQAQNQPQDASPSQASGRAKDEDHAAVAESAPAASSLSELSPHPTAALEPLATAHKIQPFHAEPLKPFATTAKLVNLRLPKLKLPEAQPERSPPPGTAEQSRDSSRPDKADRADQADQAGRQLSGSAGLAFFKAGRYAEAFLAWQDAAGAGSANGPLYIGMMFDNGQGVPRNDAAALSWYRLAADNGSPIGAYNVGVMYDAGSGVQRDAAEASEWYSHAAAKGSGRAAFNLALLFETGDGVPQDSVSANSYFKEAERSGIAAAGPHLGKPTPARSIAAMSTVDPERPFDTVHATDFGAPKAGSRDAEGAAERIRRLADTGDPAAQYDLAYCLENGIGVEIDLRQASVLYRQAAEETEDVRLRGVAEAAIAQLTAHIAAAEPVGKR